MSHRSRLGWADPMDDEPELPHLCRLPKAARLALVGLVAAMFLLLVAVGLMAVYVYQANQYVQGRGEYRDREAQRLEQQSQELSRKTACDILDALPVSPLLDRVRGQFGCGPGLPIDQLSPDERAQLSGNAQPTESAPAPNSPAPDRAAPGPTGGAAQTPPPASPEPAAPSTPPLIDLGRVTGPACDSAIVCF